MIELLDPSVAAGVGFDQVVVGGTATLDGEMSVVVLPGSDWDGAATFADRRPDSPTRSQRVSCTACVTQPARHTNPLARS